MAPAAKTSAPLAARRWRLSGQVQGVGFRPFVHGLAQHHGLVGLVRNDAAGVEIVAQGSPAALNAFEADLRQRPPAAARIMSVEVAPVRIDRRRRDFHIEVSDATAAPTAAVTVDMAVCDQCLAELLDPRDRRHRYGLINCTHCGPRYSIILRVPYDRPHTTMAAFTMCEPCEYEYRQPTDRRFHAQPTACPGCGPRVTLANAAGRAMPGDPYHAAADMLAAGRIVAVKGIGGFHLAVRADDEQAVARLRQMKQRDAKPFALMGRDLATLRRLVTLSPAAEAALAGPAAPIVLAPRRPDAPSLTSGIASAIAPGNHRLGVMLPYTPIHHLLFASAEDRFDILVMTSGNRSDEPLAIDNDEAIARLGDLCDAFLLHDRPIHRCVDDSVLLDVGGQAAPLPMRRSRGYAPMALPLDHDDDSLPPSVGHGLCVGGELKNTLAVVREGQAILSQHLGDLKHAMAYEQFRRTAADMMDLFGIAPRWIACDVHPAYLSTQYARELAERFDVPLLRVQHHHAHAASLLAEHSLHGPMLAVVCDGVGYGDDAAAWGGELLLATRCDYRRLASLRPLRLPGGDAAAKDTRRCGLGLLHQAYGDDFARHPAAARLVPDAAQRDMLCAMIRRDVHCIASSAAGRVFDGMAALLDVCRFNHFEAQAALALEALAQRSVADEPGGEGLYEIGDDAEQSGLRRIDLSPLVRCLVAGAAAGEPVEALAALMHEQLAAAWVDAVLEAVHATGVEIVGLSGGVFCNQALTHLLRRRLERTGLSVLTHKQVPANDGGLSFGQAAVAAAQLRDPQLRNAKEGGHVPRGTR